MAKQSKKSKTTNRANQKAPRKKRQNWRRFIERSLFATAILAMVGVAMAAYHNNKQIEYDLSVIGNGTPTVVQIHDPSCQLCRRLSKNLDSVKGDFKPDIQFKTANIATDSGRRFAQRHKVEHVTLMFFDKRGQRVNTIQGVTPPDNIRAALDTFSQSR